MVSKASCTSRVRFRRSLRLLKVCRPFISISNEGFIQGQFSSTETVRIAKEATITILESALKRGANIKRIVITSSIAAVWTKQDEPRTFSEDDWNEYTLPRYEAGQRDPVTAYFASKLLSERGQSRVVLYR